MGQVSAEVEHGHGDGGHIVIQLEVFSEVSLAQLPQDHNEEYLASGTEPNGPEIGSDKVLFECVTGYQEYEVHSHGSEPEKSG